MRDPASRERSQRRAFSGRLLWLPQQLRSCSEAAWIVLPRLSSSSPELCAPEELHDSPCSQDSQDSLDSLNSRASRWMPLLLVLSATLLFLAPRGLVAQEQGELQALESVSRPEQGARSESGGKSSEGRESSSSDSGERPSGVEEEQGEGLTAPTDWLSDMAQAFSPSPEERSTGGSEESSASSTPSKFVPSSPPSSSLNPSSPSTSSKLERHKATDPSSFLEASSAVNSPRDPGPPRVSEVPRATASQGASANVSDRSPVQRPAQLWNGRAISSPEQSREPPAWDPCEGNRRCRLQRFRMQQTASRAAAIEREFREQEEERKRKAELAARLAPVRQVKRFEIDGFVNGNLMMGQGLRASFGNEVLRGEALVSWVQGSGGMFSYINTSGVAVAGRGRWTLGKSDGAFYLAAGAIAHFLQVDGLWTPMPDIWIAPGDGDGVTEPWEPGGDPGFDGGWRGGDIVTSTYSASVHSATVALGFDFLTRIGFHAALEVQAMIPFYWRVRDSVSGAYNDQLGDSLGELMHDYMFGIALYGGWGF